MNERYELYKAVKWEVEHDYSEDGGWSMAELWNIVNNDSDNEDEQYWSYFWKMACLDDYRKRRGA